MHALEILFSGLQGYCNPIREYKVLTCSHPCQCLGACTAACSPGQSPGWRVQVAAPEPSFCQAGQGGHLWNLHRHTAAFFSRSTSPGPGIPLSSGSSPGFFSLSTIFGCCPLDQSSRCQILRCQPDILSIVDPLPWELSQERCRFFITCQCPCFVLSRKTHVPLITSNPWPCAWNETIASSHPPPPASTYFSLEIDFDEFSIMSSLAHMIVSPLALQSRDVVVTWPDCPEAKNPIKMTCQPCYVHCFFSIAHRQPRYCTLGAESGVHLNGWHVVSHRESFL